MLFLRLHLVLLSFAWGSLHGALHASQNSVPIMLRIRSFPVPCAGGASPIIISPSPTSPVPVGTTPGLLGAMFLRTMPRGSLMAVPRPLVRRGRGVLVARPSPIDDDKLRIFSPLAENRVIRASIDTPGSDGRHKSPSSHPNYEQGSYRNVVGAAAAAADNVDATTTRTISCSNRSVSPTTGAAEKTPAVADSDCSSRLDCSSCSTTASLDHYGTARSPKV